MMTIVDFQPKYAKAFKELNYEWINAYFQVEESDQQVLEHPKEFILDRGGLILIALMNFEPVGTCALLKRADETYELAKMAVSPRAQRKGIGHQLVEEAIVRAKDLGASSIYLETNSTLKPAIQLYHKLGFKDISGPPSPYNRCNVQMKLML